MSEAPADDASEGVEVRRWEIAGNRWYFRERLSPLQPVFRLCRNKRGMRRIRQEWRKA